MKNQTQAQKHQQKFNFSASQPRPFLANLPARIDTYEEGVARFFQWETGVDYYYAIDQAVDFVVNIGKAKVIDLLADTAVFAMQLAGRKAFPGRVYSFDSNVTLLERAKQRACHLNLQHAIEFRNFKEPRYPVQDGYGDIAVSFFDLHRHPAEEYLSEVLRILGPEGSLIIAEMLEPRNAGFSWRRTWRRLHLQYIQKNPAEARAIYYDREEMIELLFRVGCRQVIFYDLSGPATPHSGLFSLIAATK